MIVFIISVFLISTSISLLIETEMVQSKLKTIGTNILKDQLNSEVSIGNFQLKFPKELQINQLLICDKELDTLSYLDEISINIEILPLLNKHISLERIGLKKSTIFLEKLLEKMDNTGPNQDEDKPNWTFSMNHVHIESSYMNYLLLDDSLDIRIDIGLLNAQMGIINIDSLIHFQAIEMENSLVEVEYLNKKEFIDETENSNFADIQIDDIKLLNSGFNFLDTSGEFSLRTNANSLHVNKLKVDINEEAVYLEKTYFSCSYCNIDYFSMEEPLDDDLNWGKYLWKVSGEEFEVEDFSFGLNYKSQKNTPRYFNSSHLNISNIGGKITDFIVDENIFSMQVHYLNGQEKNGFEVVNLKGNLKQTDSLFIMENIEIQTQTSVYHADLVSNLNPTNYNDISEKHLDIKLDIQDGDFSEIDYFYPLQDYDKYLKQEFYHGTYQFHSHIIGDMKSLDIRNIELQYRDSIQFQAQGRLANLLNNDSLLAQLKIQKLLLSKNELEQNFIIPNTDSIFSLPKYIDFDGAFIKKTNLLSIQGIVLSDIGQVEIDSAMVLDNDGEQYVLKLKADLKHLENLNNYGISDASFKLSSKYNGENPYKAIGKINFFVDSLTYQTYTYHDIQIISDLNNGLLSAKLQSLDSNLLIDLNVDGALSKESKDIQLHSNIHSINLFELQLQQDEFCFSGNSDMHLIINQESEYSLKAVIDSIVVLNSGVQYSIPPTNLSLINGKNKSQINIKGMYIQLDFMADESLEQLMGNFANIRDFDIFDSILIKQNLNIPNFQFKAKIEYPKAYAQLLLPKDFIFQTIEIGGDFQKQSRELNCNISSPKIQYQNSSSDSLDFGFHMINDSIFYQLHSVITYDPVIKGSLNIAGNYRDSKLINNLQYLDSRQSEFININTSCLFDNQYIKLHILNPQFKFNYDDWQINPNNQILFNSNEIICQDFQINNKTQEIALSSTLLDSTQNFELKISDLDLQSIEELLMLDTLVEGKLSANIQFHKMLHHPIINGELSIVGFQLNGFYAGKLDMNKIHFQEGNLSMAMEIIGEHNDISLNTEYDFNKKNLPLNLKLNIKSFDFGNLNYLLNDYAENAKGILTGHLDLQASTDDYVLDGELIFYDAGVGIPSINNYFMLGNESISIKNNTINFHEFSISNKQKQTAKILGTISLNKWNSPSTDLQIITDDMLIMDSKEGDAKMVFGFLQAQANIGIKGKSDQFKINANLSIDKKTDITYVFPDKLTINDNNGIVHFNKYYQNSNNEGSTEKMSFFGMESLANLKSNIDIEEGAQFKLYFDDGGKDYLDAELNGNMKYDIEEDIAKITGIFNIKKGKLHYSIPMVSVEDFDIEEGSFIRMSNDIYNPEININASAHIRASTEGLLPNYNKVMTFKVLLRMIGDLNDVKLKFDISSETNDAIISSRISQLTEKERNANAINLLVRGAFIISVNGTDMGASSMMDIKVDKFFASQLNHLISDNIHFVDLYFDVQSFNDYGTEGQRVFRRNYYYNVGKTMFNDRVSIKYKGSLELSTDMEQERSNSNFVQNQLEVDYKLTKSGNLSVFLFRKDKYQGILEGDVIETGGGLRYRKSFYSLYDMFHKESPKVIKNDSIGKEDNND